MAVFSALPHRNGPAAAKSTKQQTKPYVTSVAIMCQWQNVYYIGCKHYSTDPIECSTAQQSGDRCQGWDDDESELEALNARGEKYTPAKLGECFNCEWRSGVYLARLQREEELAQKRDEVKK